MYIRNLIKHYKHRDREVYVANGGIITENTYIPPSREVYLLQKYRWLILANQSTIIYHSDLRVIRQIKCGLLPQIKNNFLRYAEALQSVLFATISAHCFM